jgi:hypothetical protein
MSSKSPIFWGCSAVLRLKDSQTTAIVCPTLLSEMAGHEVGLQDTSAASCNPIFSTRKPAFLIFYMIFLSSLTICRNSTLNSTMTLPPSPFPVAGDHIIASCAVSEGDRDISVGIRARRSGVRITAVDFPVSKHVQTDPSVHQFSTSMGTFLSRV